MGGGFGACVGQVRYRWLWAVALCGVELWREAERRVEGGAPRGGTERVWARAGGCCGAVGAARGVVWFCGRKGFSTSEKCPQHSGVRTRCRRDGLRA